MFNSTYSPQRQRSNSQSESAKSQQLHRDSEIKFATPQSMLTFHLDYSNRSTLGLRCLLWTTRSLLGLLAVSWTTPWTTPACLVSATNSLVSRWVLLSSASGKPLGAFELCLCSGRESGGGGGGGGAGGSSPPCPHCLALPLCALGGWRRGVVWTVRMICGS